MTLYYSLIDSTRNSHPANVQGKASPYSIAQHSVLEVVPVLGSQPAGDVSHKPGGTLPLLSARPAVTLATLKRAATDLAAWRTETWWVWTVCLRLLPGNVAAAIWTRALLRLSPARYPLGYRATLRKTARKTTRSSHSCTAVTASQSQLWTTLKWHRAKDCTADLGQILLTQHVLAGLDVLGWLGEPDSLALTTVLRLENVSLVLLLTSVRQKVTVAAADNHAMNNYS